MVVLPMASLQQRPNLSSACRSHRHLNRAGLARAGDRIRAVVSTMVQDGSLLGKAQGGAGQHAASPAVACGQMPRATCARPQQGGGGASTRLGSIALSASGQVNCVKSIFCSVIFSTCAQRLRLQKSS